MVRSIQDSKVKKELKVFVRLEFHLWKFLKQFLELMLRYKGTEHPQGWTSCGVDGEGGKRLVISPSGPLAGAGTNEYTVPLKRENWVTPGSKI